MALSVGPCGAPRCEPGVRGRELFPLKIGPGRKNRQTAAQQMPGSASSLALTVSVPVRIDRFAAAQHQLARRFLKRISRLLPAADSQADFSPGAAPAVNSSATEFMQ